MKPELQIIVNSMVIQTGVNPLFIYCSNTGEPIGQLSPHELEVAIHMIGDCELDDLIDELLIRTLISMRPSIAWNVMDSRSINKMRLLRPRQLLSHLMIRMYEPRTNGSHLRIPFEQRVENNRSKIQIFQIIEQLPITDLQLNQLLLVLLQIDSKFNLNAVGVKSSFPAIGTIQDDESFQGYIDRLLEWQDWLEAKKVRDDRANKMSQEYWAKGNSLSRDAAIKTFLEVTPPSPTKIKRLEKESAEKELLSMLEEIIESADKEPISESPSEPRIPGYIKPGAFKLNLARR